MVDDGADGWAVTIHPPGGRAESGKVVLRSRVPGGLAALLDEARTRIDRRLDGGAWRQAP